jgi:Beta-galactosidase trimerisation domain
VDLHGAYKVFADLHLPFDIASEKQLLTLDLKDYPLIVFPYSAFLPVELSERLREYVEQGGTLFFTYRTGQWDGSGRAATTPLFSPLRVGEDWDDQVAFMKPTTPLGDTYLRVAEVTRFECLQDAETLTTLTHPALRSTETEWVTHNVIPGKDTSSPTMIRGKLGRGVFIYCGFRLFKEHITQGLGVYRQLVERALEGVYRPRIQVQAPRVVEAIYNRIGLEIRITLVNGITNKPAGKDNLIDIDELIPISGISVIVRDGIAYAEDMKGRQLSFNSEPDGTRRIEVSRLEQFEVVKVHLSGK